MHRPWHGITQAACSPCRKTQLFTWSPRPPCCPQGLNHLALKVQTLKPQLEKKLDEADQQRVAGEPGGGSL